MTADRADTSEAMGIAWVRVALAAEGFPITEAQAQQWETILQRTGQLQAVPDWAKWGNESRCSLKGFVAVRGGED
jgi:hypothetical protein